MAIRSIIGALAVSVAAVAGQWALPAEAQTVSVSEAGTRSPLRVPLNRAIVLESADPFAELSVANPLIADIATLSERTVYVLGKLPGRTTLTLLGPDGRLMANIEVHVTPDIAEFKERLRELMPGEPIEVRTANDGIVLSGTVSSIRKLENALLIAERYAPERVLNMMVVGGTQQVQLKVRFAEMSRSVSKELGAQLSLFGSSLGGSSFLGSTGAVVPNAGSLLLDAGSGGLGLDILIEALEENGVARTLSEPNLTALSGQTASFLAGGEFPIPQVDDEGNIGVEFRPFGVTLDFTPTVVDGDIINLELDSEVSAIDFANGVEIGGGTVPAVTASRASTTVEMRDGQSFAIAGILRDDFTDSTTQVPFLGDLPVIGALFRSAQFQRAQTELVIIVTAHLVQPANGRLAQPTDRIRPPTENELFLFGRLSAAQAGAPAASSRGSEALQGLPGDFGYVLE